MPARLATVALSVVARVAVAGSWAAIPGAVPTDIAASNDGNWVAYWTVDGMLHLFSTADHKVTRDYLPDDFQRHLVWSPVASRVAFAGGAGLVEYDVAADRARVVTTAVRDGNFDYGYSASGTLCWIEDKWVSCDGSPRPVATVANRHHVFMHGNVLSCDRDPLSDRGGCTTISILDLDTRKAIEVRPPSPAFEPYLSPTRDRLCYLGGGLRCMDLATRTEVAIDRDGEFGHLIGYPSPPFSRDGKRIAWWSHDKIHICELARCRAIDVTGVVGFKGVMFTRDDTLLLWANYGPMNAGVAKAPALAELHLGSSTIDPIVLDDHVYFSPVVVPGRADVFFASRATGKADVPIILMRGP